MGWAVTSIIRLSTLRYAESQLGVEPDAVVPGEPEERVEQAVWQRHHLAETGGDVFHLEDHTFCRDNVLRALDLHGSFIDAHVADPRALACQQVDGGLRYTTNGDIDRGGVRRDVGNP